MRGSQPSAGPGAGITEVVTFRCTRCPRDGRCGGQNTQDGRRSDVRAEYGRQRAPGGVISRCRGAARWSSAVSPSVGQRF
jgi:hypothetical protein